MDLSTWTIYDHPADYPDGYVVREWIVGYASELTPGPARHAPTLDAARALIPPGLYLMPRSPEDDTTIVETWL